MSRKALLDNLHFVHQTVIIFSGNKLSPVQSQAFAYADLQTGTSETNFHMISIKKWNFFVKRCTSWQHNFHDVSHFVQATML